MLSYEITRMMAVERQTTLLSEAKTNRLARLARLSRRSRRSRLARGRGRPPLSSTGTQVGGGRDAAEQAGGDRALAVPAS